ncbi:MAG TPA: type II secretion system minor pseudopilin GspI [Burkholderiales bacterium]|nr:type II secretion system minor pseudopilin GspI [Burkholderiales bacterium]
MSRSTAAGFTLIEILVALAVLAIALTATAASLGSAIDTTGALRERMLARWVAEDRLAEIELKNEWPALDTKEGDATMGGRKLHWIQETGVTPVAKLRRVVMSVVLPGGKVPLVTLTGFVEQTNASVISSTVSQTGDLSQMGNTPPPQGDVAR